MATIKKDIISVINTLEGFEDFGRLSFSDQGGDLWANRVELKVYSVMALNWPDSLLATVSDFSSNPKELYASRWVKDRGWIAKHIPVKETVNES